MTAMTVAATGGWQAWLASTWDVFLLFTIPIGSGIPGGVTLAKSRGIGWPVMELLYFLSDLVLAIVFEPVMLWAIAAAKRSPRAARFADVFRESMRRSVGHYGTDLGPLALIGISFGVDPMTGRTAAVAAGHGFVTGWAIAITGDMLYFTLIMASTIWLNGVLGDGTWTTIIITVAMIGLPPLARRVRDAWRERKRKRA